MSTERPGAEEAQNTTRSEVSSNAVMPSNLLTALQRENSGWVGEVVEAFGEVTVIVPAEHIVEISAF